MVEEKQKSEIKEETTKKEAEKKEKKEGAIKPKKTESVVKSFDLPISTRQSIAICRFIKNKQINEAISELEKVVKLKKAIPMKGEIAHRKGEIMSGKYPKKSAGYFIKLLKNLSANANINGLEDPVIKKAVANIASRPYGKFGRVRKKRTHIEIIAKEKESKEKI